MKNVTELKQIRVELTRIARTIEATAYSFASERTCIRLQSAKMFMGIILKHVGEPNPYNQNIESVNDIKPEADKCTDELTIFATNDEYIQYITSRRIYLDEITSQMIDLKEQQYNATPILKIAIQQTIVNLMDARNWMGMMYQEILNGFANTENPTLAQLINSSERAHEIAKDIFIKPEQPEITEKENFKLSQEQIDKVVEDLKPKQCNPDPSDLYIAGMGPIMEKATEQAPVPPIDNQQTENTEEATKASPKKK